MAGIRVGSSLTMRQREVLDYIVRYLRDNRSVSPTMREIANEFFISTTAAWKIVKTLQRKEYITVEPNQQRSVVVVRV